MYEEVRSRYGVQSAQIVDITVKLGQAAQEIAGMKDKLDRNDKELKDALLANDQQFKASVEANDQQFQGKCRTGDRTGRTGDKGHRRSSESG